MKRLPSCLLIAAALLALACAPPTADELVEEVMVTRLSYDVQAKSWIIRDGSNPPEIYIEALVINNNQEATLRTLTVKVDQLDADGELLSSQRVPIDVVALTPGIGQTLGVVASPAHPDVDGITLLVEPRPDADVWAEFPEFDAVRPRI